MLTTKLAKVNVIFILISLFSILCFYLFFYILSALFFLQISLIYLQFLFEFLYNMRVRKIRYLASQAIIEGNSSADAYSLPEEKVGPVNFLLYIASGEDVSRESVDRVSLFAKVVLHPKIIFHYPGNALCTRYTLSIIVRHVFCL